VLANLGKMEISFRVDEGAEKAKRLVMGLSNDTNL
jgi:hypothetical protein